MKQPRICVFAATAALLFTAARTGRAAQATVTDDSYTSQAKPTTPMGTLPQLLVDSADHAYLKFDLSSIPAGITGAQVAKATLLLWVYRVTAPGSIDVAPVSGVWDEGSLTWNTEPAAGAPLAQPVAISAANTYVRVDVTGVVQGWLNGVANQGFKLQVNGATPSCSVFFDSKESTSTSHAAYLDIVLAGPAGATGPQGSQGPAGATGPQGPAGPNVLAAGTSSAPSLRFQTSSNTGMYSSSPQSVDFVAGGFPTLAIRPDGYIDVFTGIRLGGAPMLSRPETLSIAVGAGSLANRTSGMFNTGVGIESLNATKDGSSNTAVGYQALRAANGTSNTALGHQAGWQLTSGSANTAIGAAALASFPSQAITGSNNTAIGVQAMEAATTGGDNVGIGIRALNGVAAGSFNIAIGSDAGHTVTGNSNILIGLSAGYNLTASSSNIDIANVGVAGENGAIRIGTDGFQTKAFIAGIQGVTTGGSAVPVVIDSNGQMGTVSSSRRYKEDIHDMGDSSDGLMRLRPVTYRYKQARSDGSKPIEYGLIAEEVNEVYPELVARNKEGQIETVQYYKLDAMLLNELQKQRTEIRNQRTIIDELVTRLATLEAQVAEKR